MGHFFPCHPAFWGTPLFMRTLSPSIYIHQRALPPGLVCHPKRVKWLRSEWAQCARSKNASNGWKPGPSMLPDLHLSWSTSYKHQQDTLHTRLSWSTFHQNHWCMLSMPCQRLQCMPQVASVVEYIAPASAASPVVEYMCPGPAVYAAPASVVEYTAPAPAASPVMVHFSPDPVVCVAGSSLRRQWHATPLHLQ